MNAFSDDLDATNPVRWQTPTPAAGVKSPGQPPSQWRYETAVAEVEAIIHAIETGEMELAEVFDRFAIAIDHLRHCEAFLTQQQQRMDLLIETLADESTSF